LKNPKVVNRRQIQKSFANAIKFTEYQVKLVTGAN